MVTPLVTSTTTLAEEITEKVRKHHEGTEALRKRMDEDYSLYRLAEFTGRIESQDTDRKNSEKGYLHYTSNEPRSFYKKMHSWVTGAELIASISQYDDHPHERQIDDVKEQFVIGMLRAVDERLQRLLQPSLRSNLAFQVLIRGWFAGRALIRTDTRGRAFFDVTPWDPMHTYWELGEHGLKWAAYKIQKSRTQIETEYGLDLSGQYTDDHPLEIIDWYDETINTVVLEDGTTLKLPTPHGSPEIPIFLGNVGNAPLIQPINESEIPNQDTIRDWGESIYEGVRGIYEKNSYMWSIMLELASRMRKPTILVESRSGAKTLAEDPFMEGSEIALAEGDKVSALDFLESTKDVAGILANISGEIQRSSLPISAYGDINFQISGFAINTLNQGIGTALQPRLDAVTLAYMQIERLISAQYGSGRHNPIQLSGMDRNRKFFPFQAAPEVIAQACDPVFTLEAQLPEDDAAKVQQAQILRQPGPNGMPLFPDRKILEDILEVQSADNLTDAIKVQLAEGASPKAAAYTLMIATQNRGRPDLAQIYLGELMKILFQEMQLGITPVIPGQEQPNENGNLGGGAGFTPQVFPNAGGDATGQGPPAGLSNPGPQVPPGTPRPGASNEERLNNIGLSLGR